MKRKIEEVDFDIKIKKAFEDDQFFLEYQPIVDFSHKDIKLAECLVRWKSPVDGNIPPNIFIPVLEKNKKIIDLTYVVVQKACQSLKKILQNNEMLQLSVNIPAIMFDQHDFIQKMANICKTYKIPPVMLLLEITETTAMNDVNKTFAVMEEMKNLGFRWSIDDFGTGYSSLAYLNKFDFEKLKIDLTFVHEIGKTEKSDALVRSIIQMARALGIHTVAEGVETTEQANFLIENHCDQAQGFLYSKPVRFDELLEILKQKTIV